MPLKIELKPHESIIIGEALITNDGERTRFYIEGNVPILREKFILREKAKKHIVRFIDYISSIKIIDYNAIELIKYIDSLNITDDEKISLFNIKYNNCKKPYIWHITDTKKINISKTA